MKFVLSDTTKRHIIYKIKHDYLQLNTIVLALALVIATYLAWQSVARLQQNYTQQRELETRRSPPAHTRETPGAPCLYCHGDFVDQATNSSTRKGETVSCIRCHDGVGHKR